MNVNFSLSARIKIIRIISSDWDGVRESPGVRAECGLVTLTAPVRPSLGRTGPAGQSSSKDQHST